MVGNDIVDLKLASIQSNWQRKRFLHKIFTDDEQAIILEAENPFQVVWLFWSMKESAYKIYVRKYQNRFFAPKKLKCKLVSETEGFVQIHNESYRTISTINNDFIFTEAVVADSTSLVNDCIEFESISHTYQSEQLYKEMKVEISRNLNIPVSELQLKKNTLGIPELYQNHKKMKVLCSLSHHGNYGAYSIHNL